jgi:hypothetical protein
MTNGTPQQTTVYNNMREVATLVGWELSQITWLPTNGSSVDSSINTALQQGANVIFAPALDLGVVSAVLRQRLLDAKTAVIVGQACPNSPFTSPFFNGPTTCRQAAPEAVALANWIAADANGKPANILLSNVPQYAQLRVFGQEFQRQVPLACPTTCKVEVQNSTQAQISANQLPSLLVNRLRANPSLNYLVFDAGAYAAGILPALDAAGLLDKVKVVGKAMGPDQQAALVAKQQDAWVTAPYGGQAYAYMDSAFRVVTQSSGITLNGVQPIQLLTTVNVGTVPVPYLFAPPDALNQFKKLWRLP